MEKHSETHLTEEEIALFVEERYDQIDRERVYSHLQQCERCYTEYKNTVRWRGILKTDQDAFESSKDLVDMGMNVATRPGVRGGGGFLRSKTSGRGSRGRQLVVAVALAVMLAGVLWVADINQGDTHQFPSTIVDPVLTAAVSASSRDWIVIPGAESSFDAGVKPHRSGFLFEADSAFSASIDYLQERYKDGDKSRDVLQLLITGFLATGQLEPARGYIGEALDLFPGDREITLLSAVVAYCEGSLEESEQLFRVVLDDDPGNTVAMLNLAIVLRENGDFPEARRFLENVLTTHPGTPVAHRAQLLLKNG